MTLQDYIKLAEGPAWDDDAEWKPIQRLCCIGDRMCFPIDALVNGGKIEDGKDYYCEDYVTLLLQAIPAMAKALIEAEEALEFIKENSRMYNLHNDELFDANGQKAIKALSTIQALQENKNEQR